MAWFKKTKDIKLITSEYTTDVPELDRCSHHHLFVFDDLQRGKRNHSHLIGDWVATAFTEAQFHLWKRVSDTEETLYIALPKEDQNDTTEWSEAFKLRNRFNHWAKIKGELWKVTPQTITELDKYMQNNVLFKRRRVALEVPLKSIDNGAVERTISSQEAFMYMGVPTYWEPRLDGGYHFQPMTIFNHPSFSRRYYSYTALEE
jgi:hypothetical protein